VTVSPSGRHHACAGQVEYPPETAGLRLAACGHMRVTSFAFAFCAVLPVACEDLGADVDLVLSVIAGAAQ